MDTLDRMDNRRSEEYLALRKGLGYCWSVAVVALPDEGKELMEKWLADTAPDVQWIMRRLGCDLPQWSFSPALPESLNVGWPIE
jgi:hypothetical protein